MLRKALHTACSFPVMLASIIAVFVILGANSTVGDPDIWWHLRNAEYLFTHHSTPPIDTYSFTTHNHPWMNHEWLAEVPYYLAWQAAGLMGIHVLFVTLLCIILLGIYYWAYKESGNLKAAFIVTCFSVFLARVNFGPRTILFGYIYLLILLLLLGRYRAKGESPLWLVPPLFCLWINTHGSWLLGMIVFCIYLASGLVEGRWGHVTAVRWTPHQRQRLLMVLGASLLALLVNPFADRLVVYPFDLAFTQKLNIKYVIEWASVDFNEPRGVVVFIVLAAVFLGGVLVRDKWTLEEVLLTSFAFYAGLKHIRFLFLAAVLLAPLLAKILDSIPPYKPEIDKPLLNAIVMGFALFFVARRFPTSQDLDKEIKEKYPTAAVAYMKSHNMRGNLFNRYMWGGYLIYHCRDTKTFIDGRTDIFEYTGVLKNYLDAEGMKNPLEVLRSFQIQNVLIIPGSPLAYLLRNRPDWRIAYRDDVAIVFERVGPLPAATSVSSGAAKP